jgi:hypothetical protein
MADMCLISAEVEAVRTVPQLTTEIARAAPRPGRSSPFRRRLPFAARLTDEAAALSAPVPGASLPTRHG